MLQRLAVTLSTGPTAIDMTVDNMPSDFVDFLVTFGIQEKYRKFEDTDYKTMAGVRYSMPKAEVSDSEFQHWVSFFKAKGYKVAPRTDADFLAGSLFYALSKGNQTVYLYVSENIAAFSFARNLTSFDKYGINKVLRWMGVKV
jgi:hypothetical protein